MNQGNVEEIVVVRENDTDTASKVAIVIVFIWMLLGILAFIFSLVCFAYNGTFMQNWVGFITAIVMGPFYWIYYFNAGDYCSSASRQQILQRQIIRKVRQVKKKFGKKTQRK
jgi:hypothetical protein